jgi:hypothetical protein
VRESARHAAALSLQAQRLVMLQTAVESGNLALMGHITTSASRKVDPAGNPSQQTHDNGHVVGRRSPRKRPKNSTEYKFLLALPHRLVKCIWEFSVHECDNAWTFQLKPVNIRPARTYAFDFVRAGDVRAVRELIRSRQLSAQDREPSSNGSRTLLEVGDMHQSLHLLPGLITYPQQMAARNGHLGLCRFLLRETSFPADNGVLSSALEEVQEHVWRGYRGTDESLLEAFYRLPSPCRRTQHGY